MPRNFLFLLALALALLLLAERSPAEAGTYTVRQCDYATGSGQHDFVWQQAGAPTVDQHAGSGCGEFGLAIRNGGGGTQRTYPSGAYGGWFAYAPDGTVFTAFAGAFGALEGCCVSGMTGYGEATQQPDGGGARAYLFQGHLGNESWYAPSALRGPVGRAWSAAASGFEARRVGFQLRCGPGHSCSQGQHADLRLRGRSFELTLDDRAAPGIGQPGGSLLTGTWARGARTLAFPAHDVGGGLATLEADPGGSSVLRSPSSCTVVAGRYARLQPCPGGRAAEWTVDTTRLPDGPQRLTLRAVDAGGNVAERHVDAYVDNGPPAAPRQLSVAGGDGWRTTNGFRVTWTNPGGQHAPISRAHWFACPAWRPYVFADCVAGSADAPGIDRTGPIALPAAGEWKVVVWLEDGVGNTDAATAGDPRRLRYDPDPPKLRFLPADAGTPARVEVAVEDVSGVAEGVVEARRYGSDRWVAVPTERGGAGLTALLHEQRRAGGAYDLRARAVDAAGNAADAYGGTRTFAEEIGGPPAGGGGPSTVDGPRGVDAPRPAPGRRLRPARVTIAVRARRGRQAGRGRDRRRGRPLGGSRRWGPSRRRLTVAGGQAVLFHGRVGGRLPRAGKLVEVQAHFRGRWRTISVVRARRGDRRWRFRYAFRAAPLRATYRLRARVPREAGYPFAAGTSRPVGVTVRPRR